MMDRQKIKSYLESATNIAVLLASVAVLLVCTLNYFTVDSTPLLIEGLQKGKNLSPLPTYNYGDSPRTLIVALNTDCGYCGDSIPFYKRLIEAAQTNNKATKIVAVFQNSSNKVERYLQEKQFNANTISDANLNAFNVTATPTMILVDSKGIILDFWIGKLSKEDEEQVLKIINNTETAISTPF